MNKIEKPTNKKYYILWNEGDVSDKYHIGEVNVNQVMQTGKDNMLIFEDKSEWEEELNKLNIEIPSDEPI